MAKVEVSDLSGNTLPVTTNPYDALLQACENDPKQIQERYEQHRTARNAQQKSRILSDDFTGWTLDQHLVKLDGHQRDPSFSDERNCLVFWARPTESVKALVVEIQNRIKAVIPNIWLMPIPNLHMTALEITHSLTPPEIDTLVTTLYPHAAKITDCSKPSRPLPLLTSPLLSYDTAACALSFLPLGNPTYHHFRRDLWQQATDAGVTVASRYVVPSAHVTVARFNSANAFGGGTGESDVAEGVKMENRLKWIGVIEEINEWLVRDVWNTSKGSWLVGEERGLDFRKGTLWYGGGDSVYVGSGR